MKKTFSITLLWAVAALGVFAQNGVIRELTGEVELKPTGTAVFVPASIGDTIARDTIVSTGFKSTAVILVGSSTVAVRPLTRLSLAEIQSSSDTETLNINLQSGRIKVDVKPPAGTRTSCVVQSPSAVASVRGTTFEFDALNLRVSEGTVALQGDNGVVIPVSAGASSYVDRDGQAANPVEITQALLMPPSPVGTGMAAETFSQPVRSSPPTTGDITVTVRAKKPKPRDNELYGHRADKFQRRPISGHNP